MTQLNETYWLIRIVRFFTSDERICPLQRAVLQVYLISYLLNVTFFLRHALWRFESNHMRKKNATCLTTSEYSPWCPTLFAYRIAPNVFLFKVISGVFISTSRRRLFAVKIARYIVGAKLWQLQKGKYSPLLFAYIEKTISSLKVFSPSCCRGVVRRGLFAKCK